MDRVIQGEGRAAQDVQRDGTYSDRVARDRVTQDRATQDRVRLDPRVKFWLGLSVLALGLALMALLVTDGMYNQRHFHISRIALSGDAPHVDRTVLRETVIDMIDGNYFSLDTREIMDALGDLPWVEKVRLRRQWPDTLMIHIEEYQPIALWGEDKWLTTTGKLVALPLPSNVALPQLNGPAAQAGEVWKKYQDWASLFARHGIRLSSMSLSRQHLYTLALEYTSPGSKDAHGFSMILAESNADQQLLTFLEARRQALIETPGQIKTVDLRYPSGFSVSRYEPEALAKSDR